MNRRLFQILCLLLWTIGPVAAWAQPKLALTVVETSPADTLYWPTDSIVNYRVVVINVGNNLLNGNCEIKFKYNQWQTEVTRRSWIASNFEVGQTDTILFQDTLHNLNAQRYKGGDNIIVIWPHTDNPGAQIPDTSYFPIHVTDLTGVRDPKLVDARVDVFPNPVNDQLNIRYLESRQKIECVRILGLDGRVHFKSSRAVEQIDLAGLSNGLYFVEFKFKDGVYGAMRISKQ